MNAFATLMLLGWVPAMLLVCAVTPIRVGLLIAGIGGWLLLPEAGFELAGLPNYTKTFAISLALLSGASIFAGRELWSVRWTRWDLPMIVYVASPFCSAMANETGAYDAWTAVFARLVSLFVPYWVGHAFFNTPTTARLLLKGIFIGGLGYVIPCLYEVRFSPVLHVKFYGFFQHDWRQMIRDSGYRPIVFTPHGLAVALWMTIATLTGVALWRRLGFRSLAGLPMHYLIAALAVTAILCKSLGAMLLLLAGAMMLLSRRPLVWLLWLLLSGPIYISSRIFGAAWVGPLVDSVLAQLPDERAGSFWFRFQNEAVLIERAWERPLLGWTPWYFLQPIEAEDGTRQIVVSDSMWVISFTAYGFLGLISQFWLWMQPAFRVLHLNRGGPGLDRTPEFTTLAGIATIFMLDCVSNSFSNPIYMLAIGAVVGASQLEPVRSAGHPPDEEITALARHGRVRDAVLRPRAKAPLDV